MWSCLPGSHRPAGTCGGTRWSPRRAFGTLCPKLEGIEIPYGNVPNDLSKIKTKVAFNLNKRQLICFGCGAAVGIPAYLLARTVIGNTGGLFLMLGVMLPAFLLAMYERDGLPLEKVARNIIRAKFLRSGHRPYRTDNIYAPFTLRGAMEKEDAIAKSKHAKKKARKG